MQHGDGLFSETTQKISNETKQIKNRKRERERERERERKEGKGKQSYRRISRKRGNVVNGMLKEAKSLWD